MITHTAATQYPLSPRWISLELKDTVQRLSSALDVCHSFLSRIGWRAAKGMSRTPRELNMSAEEADKQNTTDASAGDEEEEWLYGDESEGKEEDEEAKLNAAVRTYGAPPVNLNIKTTGSRPYGHASKMKGVDLDAPGNINGVPVLEADVESFEEKPWRKPGADLSDYFNYGFNEDTWKAYCEKQKRLRMGLEVSTIGSVTSKITVQQGRTGNDKDMSSLPIHTSKPDFTSPINMYNPPINQIPRFGKCSSYKFNVTFENSTMSLEQPFHLKEVYLPTSCSDCLVILEDIAFGKDAFTSLMLFSRRQSVSPDVVEAFKTQAECLRILTPIMIDTDYEICPVDASPTDPISGIKPIKSLFEATMGLGVGLGLLDSFFETFVN
ncbi:Pre-mRNA 3'-end-processing factor FIP1 [Liparis tanakae]|uniref:Pre-mRNA 3'-end-processing factor FIP1 n=1 Tax=Liparis tanakae TaxID=230148 RepID=A0A4Z2J0I8_9TELE|nr:Pre-mRNA 3'-end-processing factor FIP1 [Liparis tanakae]